MSVPASYRYIDKYMAHVSAETAKLGKPIRCAGAGCFACCLEPVYAEKREAAYLVTTLPMATMLEVRERTQDWWNLFFGEPGLDRMPHPERSNWPTLLRYRQAKAWCPVLKAGLCTGYGARPASCRLHVVSGSPKRCEDDAKRQKQQFVTTGEQHKVITRAAAILADNAPVIWFEYDHLGVWLGHILLGETKRSNAAKDYMIRQTEPEDMPAQFL